MAGEFVDSAILKRVIGSQTDKLPQIPGLDDIVFEPGWTRYTQNKDGSFEVQKVACPDEPALIFDTETFVTNGAFPVIGSALGSKIRICLARCRNG